MSVWQYAEMGSGGATNELLKKVDPEVAKMFSRMAKDNNPANRFLAVIMQQMYLDIRRMAQKPEEEQNINELTNPLVNHAEVIKRMRKSGTQYAGELDIIDQMNASSHVGV